MYAVVGCNDCGNFWLLSDPDAAETARCSRCGKRHRTRKLKRFFESRRREEARQARAAMLADKRGEREAFRDLDSVGEMERRLDEAGIDDRTYLEASGLDADAVAEAGEQATESGGTQSRSETLRAALRDLDEPTEEHIREYCEERGVPADYVGDALSKLVRAGEVTEQGGTYRLL